MRIPRAIIFALLLFLLVPCAFAQKLPAPTPTVEPETADGDVIRISSKLVLLDALVVDSENSQVRDLTADDFVIFQDGKQQEITSFSYVDGTEGRLVPQKAGAGKNEVPPPPVKLSGVVPGRVITFVIDDGNCLASMEGISLARGGVKKFIAEQMRPDDKVAIYRTRGGSSLLQMYTSNKEVLRREVNKVKWTPSRCGTAFEAARDKSTLKVNGQGATSFESESDREAKAMIDDNERNNQVIGSLGVLGFVVDRLRTLPQRKLLFFISEGVTTKFGSRAYDSLRELTDKATRSSVVIYTLGAKGVTVPGFMSAQDEVLPGIITGQDDTYALVDSRLEEERALNEGMAYLAYSTGGRFIRNQNFLGDAVEDVLEVETGYYLLGYEPESESFEGREYHRIEVRLRRPGLRITSRKGFFGGEGSPGPPAIKGNTANPLYDAVASPFAENSMDVRLTALVKRSVAGAGKVRVMFHVGGEDLSFALGTDGLYKVVMNVVLVALDEKGRVAAEFNRTYPIRVPERGVSVLESNGLDFSTDVEFEKAGFYSLRLAVQDPLSRKLGSAGDYIQIPSPKDRDLRIGALVTTGYSNEGNPLMPGERPVSSSFAPVFGTSAPSIRRYRPGSRVAYLYDLHNAGQRRDEGAGLVQSVRLYREGVLVFESAAEKVSGEDRDRDGVLEASGSLVLNDSYGPGEYVLQVNVKDGRGRTASQWIDLEIVR